MEENQTLPTKYTSFYLVKDSSNGLIVSQNNYANKLEEESTNRKIL